MKISTPVFCLLLFMIFYIGTCSDVVFDKKALQSDRAEFCGRVINEYPWQEGKVSSTYFVIRDDRLFEMTFLKSTPGIVKPKVVPDWHKTQQILSGLRLGHHICVIYSLGFNEASKNKVYRQTPYIIEVKHKEN
ncbi:hypothetical protein MMO38_09435 [Acinetobacter sp. NIPH 1852]|uniref:hypothetical protein n=1 Tax=Acinetobacter sp. NIPH 1852 TaxID=2923428 RepID=UPI001F4B6BD7|nr:hypothetical protein [Acinetobacter sp. NIPH 1852]MCH7308358.1 hypothetical protein [Acinetobacter sp. NIPH 1852]